MNSFKLLVLFFITSSVYAAQRPIILSPSAQEVNYQYSFTFQSDLAVEDFKALGKSAQQEKLEEKAYHHVQHIYGIMQSLELAESLGVDSDDVYGIGAPKEPLDITVKSYEEDAETGFVKISYRTKGIALLHKKVAKKWLKVGSVSLPLLQDLSMVYGDAYSKWRKCTDPHYLSDVDFWYFYDPYREGCEELQTSPIADAVEIKISELDSPESIQEAEENSIIPMDKLLADNGNGDVYSVYVIIGYAEGYNVKDEGYKIFQLFGERLVNDYGLTQITAKKELDEFSPGFPLQINATLESESQARFIRTYIGTLKNQKTGKPVKVVVRTLLNDTEFDGSRVTFAKMWKEAWENGDAVYYNGHSGSGGNMSDNNLSYLYEMSKSEPIQFNRKKTQIVFIDACSSYSYYSLPYFNENPNASIITYGLPSYFDSASQVGDVVLKLFLKAPKSETKWIDALKKLEAALQMGDGLTPSYLINLTEKRP